MSIKTEKLLKTIHLAPRTGAAFRVAAGEILRVLDVAGEQVVDLVCFAAADPTEYLSSGRTIDYNNKIYLTTGDILYSDRSNPMLTIVEDTVGKHDFLFAPCSPEMFRLTYGVTEPHPNCLENLSAALDPFGIRPSIIPVAFNVFMNATVSADGRVSIAPPRSQAGDFVDLQAGMDLIVGVSACSAEKCNNYRCTPIDVAVFSGSSQDV
jgi:uncharacterized protein YcgI (DUF1989 family)